MQVVKSVLRVQLAEGGSPWLQLRQLLRAAGAEGAEVQAGPLVIDRPDDKKRVVIQVRAVSFEHEMPSSVATVVRDASKLMKDLNAVSPFQDLAWIRHDLLQIEAYELPFHELLSRLKEKFLSPTRVSKSASDIGLIFDVTEGSVLKHAQFGPMDDAQLTAEFLRWPPPSQLPQTFVFLNTAYQITGGSFSPESLDAFLHDSTGWQQSESEAIVKEIKGEG